MWKFYEHEGAGYRLDNRLTAQGPVAARRWQPDGKRHKLSYRFKKPGLGPRSTDKQMETKARDYAFWLAARDGIELPATYQVTCIWAVVTVGDSKWDNRISGVRFGTVLIELPNWNFVAVAPVETIEPAQVAA